MSKCEKKEEAIIFCDKLLVDVLKGSESASIEENLAYPPLDQSWMNSIFGHLKRDKKLTNVGGRFLGTYTRILKSTQSKSFKNQPFCMHPTLVICGFDYLQTRKTGKRVNNEAKFTKKKKYGVLVFAVLTFF